jgi:hypothetical protein
VRTVLHRVHVLINPLLWLAGGVGAEHRSEFLSSAVDLARHEVAEEPTCVKQGDQDPDP